MPFVLLVECSKCGRRAPLEVAARFTELLAEADPGDVRTAVEKTGPPAEWLMRVGGSVFGDTKFGCPDDRVRFLSTP